MSPQPSPQSIRSLGIGPRLTLVTAVVSVLVGLSLTSLAAGRLRAELEAGARSEGEALAQGLALAARLEGVELQGLLTQLREQHGLHYLFVVDSTNRLLAHTLPQSPPPQLLSANTVAPGELSLQQRSKLNPEVELEVQGREVHALDVAVPMDIGVVHVGLQGELLEKRVASLWRTLLLVALGLAVLGAAGAALLARSVVGPLRELIHVASQIVETGDLTRSVAVSSSAEVGQLAHFFMLMVERLRGVTLNLQKAVSELTQSTQGLSASSSEQSQTITRQAVALQETQVTAQEIKQTSLLAAQKAAAVLSVAERADQLSRAGEQAIEQTMAGLNEIRIQVGEIAKKILELGERTAQIGGITETVKDLADQSNMLALNAAIESVRSGEHGRGFGVVAREIRALADQSIEATNRVRELLDDISNSVKLAVRITEHGSKRVEAGLEQVNDYGNNLRELSSIVQDNATAVRQIAAAVNQQNVGINQITAAVADLSKMMDDTVARIGSTAGAISTLQGISEQLNSASKAYRVG